MENKDYNSIAIIYFSKRGKDLASIIKQKVNDTYSVVIVSCLSGELYNITKELWKKYKYIIFISSTGIAVRAIATHVVSKLEDPAILVIDERALHVISLLSGHYGGANALTSFISKQIKSEAVITTATDLYNIFSFDSFAKENHLRLKNSKMIKIIARHMIEKKDDESKVDIMVYTPYKISSEIPKYITLCKNNAECDVLIDIRDCSTDNVLCLIPHNLVLGIGCRKDTSYMDIENAFLTFMRNERVFPEAICSIASIDLKKNEEGILEFSKNRDIPFYTYGSYDLKKVETICNSEFVKNITGVGCVCEAAAIYHTRTLGNCNLIVNKTVINHITFALCEIDVNLHWNLGDK